MGFNIKKHLKFQMYVVLVFLCLTVVAIYSDFGSFEINGVEQTSLTVNNILVMLLFAYIINAFANGIYIVVKLRKAKSVNDGIFVFMMLFGWLFIVGIYMIIAIPFIVYELIASICNHNKLFGFILIEK